MVLCTKLNLKERNLFNSRSNIGGKTLFFFVIKILFASLIFCLMPTDNAGVHYYLNYSEKGEVKVVCADGKANHIVELLIS